MWPKKSNSVHKLQKTKISVSKRYLCSHVHCTNKHGDKTKKQLKYQWVVGSMNKYGVYK